MNRRAKMPDWKSAFHVTLLVVAFVTRAGAFWNPSTAAAEDARSGGGVLTNITQILRLGTNELDQENVRVKFRGILIYQDVFDGNAFFVQDESASIVALTSPGTNVFDAGDEVEVTGVVIPELIAPAVKADKIRSLGHVGFPVPKPTRASRLAAGEDFGNWVEIEATVRDMCRSKNRLVLACVDDGVHFQVWCTQRGDLPLPTNLLDARLRLRGMSWTTLDGLRRPIGFLFRKPDTNWITVLQAGAADIFHRPTQTIANLRPAGILTDARVKVAGVVTLASPGGLICLQDATRSVIARLFQPIPRDEDPRGKFLPREKVSLVPGDLIEVVGAVQKLSAFAPVLVDSEYRLTGHHEPPVAHDVTTDDLLTGKYDAGLVRLKGRVLDIESPQNLDLFEEKI